ncbi:MAG: hypothetical protein MKZ52_05045 [Candidatus Thalassarchaeum sp.]|nr:hypothetical protein [Candidatus Thalassarchaeum sp.]
MGERKCAFEGCNALEFRTSGYCLRHKDEAPLGGTAKDEAPPESVILFPGFTESQQEWELDGGFFAGLVLPYSLILLSVLLDSAGGSFPEDLCCLMLLSPPLFSALIMNTADKDRNLSVGKGAKLSLWIWVGLASLGFLFVASLF